jgi:hypothetical protein
MEIINTEYLEQLRKLAGDKFFYSGMVIVKKHIIKSSNYEAMERKFSRLCALHTLNNNFEEAKKYAVAREIVSEIIEERRSKNAIQNNSV